MISDMGIGLDVGSTTTKTVLINLDGTVLAKALFPTGASAQKAAQRCLDVITQSSKYKISEAPIISTGYGRKQVSVAIRSITEITCHSIGIHHLNPEIRTLIDVGGQDSKVIRIGENGKPTDFELNDKCSAGTGRFLEVMARVLEISINELGPLALKASAPLPISSTCTVFAESEVVGRIGAGDKPAPIAAGVHEAMAAKIATLSQRVGVQPPIAVSGGVALNPAFRFYLEQQLKYPIWLPPDPQYTGALGAAILACNSSKT